MFHIFVSVGLIQGLLLFFSISFGFAPFIFLLMVYIYIYIYIYIYLTCVRVCVFARGGHSFCPIVIKIRHGAQSGHGAGQSGGRCLIF